MSRNALTRDVEEEKPLRIPYLNIDPWSLIPSPRFILQSAALAVLFFSSCFLAVAAWVIFYRAMDIALGIREDVYLQYGHFRAPYADIALDPIGRYVASDQPYDLTLHALLPHTPRNVELGNFMVSIVFEDALERSLLNISRPAALPYRTPASLVLGSVSPFARFKPPETQHLEVPLLVNQVIQTRRKVPHIARLELGRKDAHWDALGRQRGEWTGQNRGEVQVERVWLQFDAHLTGLRWMLYHHSWISFIIFFSTFLFLELLSGLLLWVFMASRGRQQPGAGSPRASDDSWSGGGGRPARKTSPVRIKKEEDDQDRSLFAARDREELRESRLREMEAQRRTGTLMTGVAPPSETDESATEGDMTETAATEGSEAEAEETAPKDEDTATVGGSTTTRGSTSTFGPSVGATTATGTSRTSDVRERRPGPAGDGEDA